MGIKHRIIPVILYDEHGCVKGQGFNPGRRIGSVRDRLRLLERRDIDELILLDISATPNNRAPRFDAIAEFCDGMFCPVTVGGGIRSVADARRILAGGADKCAVGTAAIEHPELIDDLSRKFGAQAVTVSIDVSRGFVCAMAGKRGTSHVPRLWALECERRGAGEILLTDIERDGTMQGYNLELIRSVSDAVSIPVIAAGGCGSYEHMREAFEAGAHAVASGAMFQFMECTPKGAARYLSEHGVATRV